MIPREETEKILKRFNSRVISESKKNLTIEKINASKSLFRSMKGNVVVSPNSIDSDIKMKDYGKLIDKGVRGSKSSFKAPTSPYSYKNKKPPLSFIRTWLKRKTGKFRQRGLTSMAYAVQNTIFNEGIRTTNFFTRPFEAAFKELPDEVIEAYGLDVENFMEFILKEDG